MMGAFETPEQQQINQLQGQLNQMNMQQPQPINEQIPVEGVDMP